MAIFDLAFSRAMLLFPIKAGILFISERDLNVMRGRQTNLNVWRKFSRTAILFIRLAWV